MKCNSINDVADICKSIWSIIAEWQGQEKPEEECINYMTVMWKGIFNGDMKVGGNPKATYVMIPFEIYDKN